MQMLPEVIMVIWLYSDLIQSDYFLRQLIMTVKKKKKALRKVGVKDIVDGAANLNDKQ